MSRRWVVAFRAVCRRTAAVLVVSLVASGLVAGGSAGPAAAATGSDPYADLYIVGQYNSSLLRIAAGGGETSVGSGLSDPYQVSRARDGSLYVADAGNNRIVRIAADGTQTTAVTGLSYPNAVNIDSTGTIYVGQGNQLLKVVGGVQSTITVPGGVTPYGIAVDPSDNVFVADYTRNRVIKVTSTGIVSVYATGIAFPTGIVADANGVVYVTSATAYTIIRIATDGTWTPFATGVQYSWGLAIDGRGNLFASSNGSSAVYKMPPDFPGGNATAIVTGLNSPIGLVVSSAPPPPTAVAGTPGDTKVTVDWTASATYGGWPVTNYTVTSSPGNHTCTTSGATTCEVTGLTNGQAYTFTVTATNNGGVTGQSAVSDPSAQVTPAAPGPPSAPASLTVVPGAGELDLSFPPAGGSGILRYEVSVDGGAWTTLTTAGTDPLSATVGNLTNGTTYGIRVRAVNANGDGGAVGPVDGTPRTVPGAPTGVGTTGGSESATVTFTPPADNGGSSIIDYEVSTDDGGTWTSVTTTAGANGTRVATLTGLTNGTAYQVKVRAVNAAGPGAESPASSVTPAVPVIPPPVPSPPAAPASATATAGTSSIAVSWPAASGAVTGYTAYASPGPGSCATTASDTSCVIGAVAGTSYVVTVIAQGPGGSSAPSPASNAVIPSAPVPPAQVPDDVPLTLTTDKGRLALAAPAQQITVIGTGFAPYSTVQVSIYSAPIQLATVTTDGNGTFSMPVTVPADLAAGQHTFLAVGVNEAGTARKIGLPVTVPPTRSGSTGTNSDTQRTNLPVPAGGGITLLDAGGRPVTMVTIDGQGTYALDATTGVITFVPVAGFAGTANSVTYRISDAVGSVVTGTYTAVVTEGGAGTPGPSPSTGSAKVTVTKLMVTRGAPARATLPVIVTFTSAIKGRNTVVLWSTVSGKRVILGTGRVGMTTAGRRAAVTVKLNPLGRAMAATPGGYPVAVAGTTVPATGRTLRATSRTRLVLNQFTVPRSVYFGTDSSRISVAQQRYLVTLRAKLSGARAVTCIGRTDDRGSKSYSQRLGKRRATAVCRLVSTRPNLTTHAISKGEANPTAGNDTAAGRARNRRVDITIHY
ncbi:fibronectin type III domain-containing protein [Pseudosporangium ferrugineum]|nr:fibronectin type III domain-containing protein [Pseudosporangium ferrugineum]